MADDRLREVFEDVFGISSSQFTDDLSPETLENWDSLSHVRLITAIEERFGVTFETSDVMEMANVAAIRTILGKRLGTAP